MKIERINLPGEIWMPIPEYEGYYMASSLGRIWSNKKNIIKVQRLTKHGYMEIALHREAIRRVHKVHRIVCSIWHLNPFNKPQVNHRDGVKTNNSQSNLEWATGIENMIHAKELGLTKRPSKAA